MLAIEKFLTINSILKVICGFQFVALFYNYAVHVHLTLASQ